MHFRSFLGAAVLGQLVGAYKPSFHLPRSASSSPVINTTYGYVQGGPSEYRTGVTSYKGVPFAAPPTGSNRWNAPQAPAQYNSTLNATTFGPQCAQSYSAAGIFSTGKNPTSEDCLTLNVWTPTYNTTANLTSMKLPVYVWIFGGRVSYDCRPLGQIVIGILRPRSSKLLILGVGSSKVVRAMSSRTTAPDSLARTSLLLR